jgi:hypothetical protein
MTFGQIRASATMSQGEPESARTKTEDARTVTASPAHDIGHEARGSHPGSLFAFSKRPA